MSNSGHGGEFRSMAEGYWKKALPIIGWKYYYTSGETFDCTQGTCCRAPTLEVAALVAFHPEGRKTRVMNHDEYLSPGCSCRKLGGQLGVVNGELWQAMHRRIVADPWRPDRG